MEHTKQIRRMQHRDEFEALLNGYSPSELSLKLLRSLPLVLLVGPTAAGRNTLINILVKTGRYHFITSDTSRSPRANNGILEQNGKEYWFKTEAEIITGLKNGDYIEAAIIHREYVYGMNISEITRAAKAAKTAINEIEIVGATNIYTYKPDTMFIFLLPPSFEVWMQRIRGRGDMNEIELKHRLESAVKEITQALESDYFQFVINHEIHEAADAVDELANGRAIDSEKQQKGRDHAEQLLIDVRLYLESIS